LALDVVHIEHSWRSGRDRFRGLVARLRRRVRVALVERRARFRRSRAAPSPPARAPGSGSAPACASTSTRSTSATRSRGCGRSYSARRRSAACPAGSVEPSRSPPQPADRRHTVFRQLPLGRLADDPYQAKPGL